MPNPVEMTSNRPYLLRALHEWIINNDMTPHLLVDASVEGVDVPAHVIQNGKVILNTALGAVQDLELGNEWILMSARFSGKAYQIIVPVTAVIAVYARENGQGMMFAEDTDKMDPTPPNGGSEAKKSPVSHLKVVK